jgi:hypothetical protein
MPMTASVRTYTPLFLVGRGVQYYMEGQMNFEQKMIKWQALRLRRKIKKYKKYLAKVEGWMRADKKELARLIKCYAKL